MHHESNPSLEMVLGGECIAVWLSGCNPSSAKKLPKTPDPNSNPTASSGEASLPKSATTSADASHESPIDAKKSDEVTEAASSDSTSMSSESNSMGAEGKRASSGWGFDPTLLAEKQSKGESNWYRYGLLLDDGPLLIDFVTSVGDEGLMESRSRRHAEIRAFLAESTMLSRNDAESTDEAIVEKPMAWTDVLSHPMVRGRVFANLQADGEMQGSSLVRQYDRDGDGQADPSELHAFLTRGLSERPAFVLDEASEFRGVNRDESPLFVRLDTDSDAVLNAEEISKVVERISILDRNGDRVISLEEVQAPTADRQAYMRRRRSDALDLAMPIQRDSKGRLEAELLSRYEVGEGIDRVAWPESEGLFKTLDQNQDSKLEKSELSGIAISPSNLVIRLVWTPVSNQNVQSSTEMNSGVPFGGTSQYQIYEGESRNREGEMPADWLWEKPKIRLRFRLHDPLSAEAIEKRVSQIAESMGVTKDRPQSVVEGLAFGPMGVTAAGMDRDRDGKLSWDEVMWSVRAKATLTSELVRVRLVEIPDSWFTWLDQDWDDVLSESEIANSTTRLAQLFSASDSDLAPESLPVQLDVLVTRAYGDEDPFGSEVFVRSTAPSPESKPLPEWFQAMDTNGDGLVTRREFLGGDESLKSLDRDRNGWLDIHDL